MIVSSSTDWVKSEASERRAGMTTLTKKAELKSTTKLAPASLTQTSRMGELETAEALIATSLEARLRE